MNHDANAKALITAGFTAYNAADTIERAVQSALAQTWRPLEIVIVDDASMDATPAILGKLAAQHPEIRVFRNSRNLGVAATRNRVLDEARGVFFAFFDDDDVSLPDRFAVQHRRITEYERDYAGEQPVICHTARLQRYPDGSQRRIGTMAEREGRLAPHGMAVVDRILRGVPLDDAYGACSTCAQMARLSAYRMVGGFDGNLRRCDDTEFNVRFAKAGGHFVGVAEPQVIQYMNWAPEKSLYEEHRNMLLILEKHRDVMDRFGQYEFCRNWLEVKYAYHQGRRGTFLTMLMSLFLRHPLWTLQRFFMAVPNINLNRAFGRFHLKTRPHH